MLFPVNAALTYTLRAVIVHQGGAKAGHYVAYARATDEAWYFYNDAAPPRQVRNRCEVLQQQAYMLFYDR